MTLRVSEYKGNLQVQDCYQAFIYVDINKCHCFFRLLYYYTSLFSACKVRDFGLSSRSLVPLKGGRKVCTLWKNIQVYYYKTTHFTEQRLTSFKMEGDENLKCCYGSYRFKLAIIVMSMSMLGVSYRMSISFAIVCMVNHTAVHDLKVESLSGIWMNETASHQLYNETDDLDTLACELQTIKDSLSLEVRVFTIERGSLSKICT